MKLKDKIQEEIDSNLKDKKVILAAEGITGIKLRYKEGSPYSKLHARGDIRLNWIAKAKEKYIEDHQREIIELAGQLIDEYLEGLI